MSPDRKPIGNGVQGRKFLLESEGLAARYDMINVALPDQAREASENFPSQDGRHVGLEVRFFVSISTATRWMNFAGGGHDAETETPDVRASFRRGRCFFRRTPVAP